MEERSDVKPPVVLALDFGGTKIAAAVAELHGERLAEGTTRTEPSRGARWNLHQGLSLARRLLETTDLSVDRVADDAGFGSPAALRMHFQRAVHTSPLAYRRVFSRTAS